MKIKWRMDDITWNRINNCLDYGYIGFFNECKSKDSEYILDWGGGEGGVSKKLKKNSTKIMVNIDPEFNSLKSNPDWSMVVSGIGQKLPFKGQMFAGVHIRASLHHAYHDLDACLDERYRVLSNDGVVFIQEPLNANPLSRIARKIFPTDKHNLDEKPLNPKKLLNCLSPNFEIKLKKFQFLTSYLFPHIICRVPLKPIWRVIAFSLLRIDKWLLKNCRFLRLYAEYITVIGVKRQ